MNVVVKLKDLTVEELEKLGEKAKDVYISGDLGEVVFIEASNDIIRILDAKGVCFDILE